MVLISLVVFGAVVFGALVFGAAVFGAVGVSGGTVLLGRWRNFFRQLFFYGVEGILTHEGIILAHAKEYAGILALFSKRDTLFPGYNGSAKADHFLSGIARVRYRI